MAAAARVHAEDVLDNVPRDALAMLFIRDVAAVDAGLRGMELQKNIALTPRALLQAVFGPDAGLDANGDLLLVALASDRPLDNPPLCAWVPVNDYERFARALRGNPDDRVTVVTVLGEDLLCAHHGEWALLMDADQRERMNATLAGRPDPPRQLAAWGGWLASQNLAATVFPTEASARALRDWLSSAPDGTQMTVEEWMRQAGSSQSSDDALTTGRHWVHRFFTLSPKLDALILQPRAAAIGIRFDASGNAVAGLRVAWPEAGKEQGAGSRESRESVFALPEAQLPSLHRETRFVISGSGRLPRAIVLAATESHVNYMIDEWQRANVRTKFDADSIDRLRNSCEDAAGDVLSIAVFQALGGEREGVSTDQFLAVRVASADAFVTRTAEVMRCWNELNGSAEPSTGMVFDSRHVQIAGRPATQYSLDIAAADGSPDIPEIRQLMERFFGPDRKMHLLVVPIDEQTVLLAAATPDQVAATLTALTTDARSTWNESNTVAANQLLPRQADWRLFVNLEGYTILRKREIEATLGDVIGGPTPRLFPASPPIGLTGGFRDRELWIDAAVPADTVKAIGRFLNDQ